MGSASGYIHAIIFGKRFDEIFTTRDFLRCGSRAAVDKTLARFIKRGIIKRLARGVFARAGMRSTTFSDEQIARVKANSFGRQIRAFHDIARIDRERSALTPEPGFYLIDGGSSSFKIENRVIRFKKKSKRQMNLRETKAGHAISVLWCRGKNCLNVEQAKLALSCFSFKEREEVWEAMRWMPAWLKHGFKHIKPPLKSPRDFLVWLNA